MSNTMKLQTRFDSGHTTTEQRFGKPNSLPDAKNEVEITAGENLSPSFVRLTIGSGGSPCWVNIKLEKVVEVTRRGQKTTARTVTYVTLNKAALLQLAANLVTIANDLKPIEQARPDLCNQIPSAKG